MPPPHHQPFVADIEEPTFSLDEMGIGDEGYMSVMAHAREGCMTTMAHDGEASGSGSHTYHDYGTELGAAIFGTPMPPPPVYGDDPVWDTAARLQQQAEYSVETPRDRVWPRRENAGVPPERWSPSTIRRGR